MKKYKIGKRIIKADSVVEAVKISRMLDSPKTKVKSKDNEIDELTQEEQQAVEDYREAIKNTSNPKLLEIYSHILKEETEHLEELAQAREYEDSCGKMKDDRLSPQTYRKLKELGVRPEQWRKMTQEQANEFIRQKSQKGSEKKEEKKQFEPKDEWEADAMEDVRKTLLYEDNISDTLEETQKEAYDTYEMTYGAEPDENAKAEINRLVEKAYRKFRGTKSSGSEEKSETNNAKSTSAPLKNKGNIDYDGIRDIPKGSTIRFEQDVPFYEKNSAADFDMTEDEFKAYMKKIGFKLKNDMWTLPKGTVAKNWSGVQKYSGPTFEINGEEVEINPLEDETVKITWE